MALLCWLLLLAAGRGAGARCAGALLACSPPLAQFTALKCTSAPDVAASGAAAAPPSVDSVVASRWLPAGRGFDWSRAGYAGVYSKAGKWRGMCGRRWDSVGGRCCNPCNVPEAYSRGASGTRCFENSASL